MTSFAISPLTMPSALAAADPYIRDNHNFPVVRHEDEPVWYGNPLDDDQTTWLAHFRRRARLAATLPEIRNHATTDPSTHVAWLKVGGWDAQVAAGAPGDLFLAAVLDVAARWRAPGRAYRDGDRNHYHRVHLKEGVTMLRDDRNPTPVVEVETQDPRYAFRFHQVTLWSRTARDDRALLASTAQAMMVDPASGYDRSRAYLDFPMVDLRCQSNAEYMLGLRYGDNTVAQATEQFRLELDEYGGRAHSAAEVRVTRGLDTTPTIRIDGPFVVAVALRNAESGLDRVVFAAYVDLDSWTRPLGMTTSKT